MADKPNPGSAEALALGCTCPVMDNHHGQGMPYPDGPQFWVNSDCKLHGNVDPVIAELPDADSASKLFCDVCGWAVPPGGRHALCEPEGPHA